MNQWMSGLAAAVLASAVWFPTMSTTQDPSLAIAEDGPKEIAGLRLAAKVEFPEKAPEPRLVLEATNPSGKEIKATVTVMLMETNYQPYARMIPTPRKTWEKEITLEVAPGKSEKLSFSDLAFAGFAEKSEKKDDKGFGRETLRELVVVCDKERVTLIGGNRFSLPELKDIK